MNLIKLPFNSTNREQFILQICTTCKQIQSDSVRNHRSNLNCKFCDDSRKINTTYDVSCRIQSKTNSEFLLIGEYLQATKPISILHKICKHIQVAQFQQFRNKGYKSCLRCSKKEQWNKHILQQKISEFDVMTEFNGREQTVTIRCKKCSFTRDIIATNSIKYSCEGCKGNMQTGEKIITDYLLETDTEFTSQYKIGNLFCDFKIGDLVIEYDGDQHYCDQWLNNNQSEDLKIRYDRDIRKENLLKQSGLKLLRIDYTIRTNKILYYVLDHILQKDFHDMPISSQVSINTRQRFNDYRNHAEMQKRVGYISTEMEMVSTLKFMGEDIVWSYRKL